MYKYIIYCQLDMCILENIYEYSLKNILLIGIQKRSIGEKKNKVYSYYKTLLGIFYSPY